MKFLKISGIVLLVLLLAIICIPFIFKGKIVQIVREQANNSVNAHISFSDDIGLNLFSSFPNLTLGLKDISIVGMQEFEKDTLFAAKQLDLTLDIMSVIEGKSICIRKIFMDQASVYALILPNGKANWDISKPSQDSSNAEASSSGSMEIKLKKVEMRDASVHYHDMTMAFETKLVHANYIMKGDFANDVLRMSNSITQGNLSVWMNHMALLNGVDAKAEAAIDADMKAFKFTFSENSFWLNQLELGMDGWVQMTDSDILTDMKLGVKQNDFKAFLSLIPTLYAHDFASLETKGKLVFSGFAKGTYNEHSMPAFGLQLGVENGWFKYPSLPAPVENVQVALKVNNPDGQIKNTVIDLSQLHLEIEKEPVDMKLQVRNPGDPFIDLMAKGKLDFTKIARIVPLPEGTQLSGTLAADITAKGRVKDVEEKHYELFNATGNFEINQMKYASLQLPQGITIQQTKVDVSPKALHLQNLDAVFYGNEMHMSGSVENFLSYAFNNGILDGQLQFSSPSIDANKIMGTSTDTVTKTADTASMSAPEIPERIHFTLHADINKLAYSNMLMEQFSGTIRVLENTLQFDQVALKTLGSAMKMSGAYHKVPHANPSMDMHFSMLDLDIPTAFKTFNTIQKMAPVAEKMTGAMDADFTMQASMDEHMKPVYEQVQAIGKVKLKNASIQKVEALDKLADAIKRPDLKQLSMNDVAIAFEVKNGRIYTQPFDIKAGGKTITLSGSTGLDQTIDYTGKTTVSRSELGVAGAGVDQLLGQLNAAAGTNLKLNEQIGIGFTIKGTFTKPQIGTNLSDVAKSESTAMKNQLQGELDAKKKQLEEAAKAEADRLKKEAEAKAKAELDRLKKEGEDKLKKEADNLKKKAEEEAKNRLKGLFK